MQRKVCARKIDEIGRTVVSQDTVPLVTKAVLKFYLRKFYNNYSNKKYVIIDLSGQAPLYST